MFSFIKKFFGDKDSANRTPRKRKSEDFSDVRARTNPYILMELPFKDALYIRNSTLPKIVQPFSPYAQPIETHRENG
ncbi:MAG: hypothetical protein SPK03_02605 [Alloprevotella sp.]|nr:hypothetical protein [Alloprevotella sp.]